MVFEKLYNLSNGIKILFTVTSRIYLYPISKLKRTSNIKCKGTSNKLICKLNQSPYIQYIEFDPRVNKIWYTCANDAIWYTTLSRNTREIIFVGNAWRWKGHCASNVGIQLREALSNPTTTTTTILPSFSPSSVLVRRTDPRCDGLTLFGVLVRNESLLFSVQLGYQSLQYH